MSIILCYRDYKIGKLNCDGEKYNYEILPDYSEFEKKYAYLAYNLRELSNKQFDDMPPFFSRFVERLINNVGFSSKLDINLEKDTYFDILTRYAELPQDKNTFNFMVEV